MRSLKQKRAVKCRGRVRCPIKQEIAGVDFPEKGPGEAAVVGGKNEGER